MDDSYFFAVLFYLVVSSFVAGVLPSSFYSGTQIEGLDTDDFREISTSNIDDVDSFSGQLNFFQKVLTFLFITWEIVGIPLFFTVLIFFINICSLLIAGIYTYDKLRGI
jgi:hypothetical protein